MSDIIVYTKTNCPYCAKLKEILRERGISFIERDFIKEPKYVPGIITRQGNTPSPQVEYKGKIVFDYTTEESLVEEINSWTNS
ncbi:glutaredoxin [Candidatus Pacearchaeota archaeon]|nr:glutaredoxin [Candidatus Pacearchaeota archaeon]